MEPCSPASFRGGNAEPFLRLTVHAGEEHAVLASVLAPDGPAAGTNRLRGLTLAAESRLWPMQKSGPD